MVLNGYFSTIDFPEEVVVARVYRTTARWADDSIVRDWPAQSEAEAILSMRRLYPDAYTVDVEYLNDLTNHMSWITHPDGYMY